MVAPHIRVWHVPNGGLRTKSEAARLKWVGVLAGVLDLTLMLPEGRCAFWETKTPIGRLSDDQKDMIKSIERLGHTWAIVLSIDDARRELKLPWASRCARGDAMSIGLVFWVIMLIGILFWGFVWMTPSSPYGRYHPIHVWWVLLFLLGWGHFRAADSRLGDFPLLAALTAL